MADSSVSVRPYTPEDWEGYRYVRQYVYNGGEPVEPDAKLIREDTFASVAEKEGQIVAACNALDMTCTRGRAVLKCAGVAAVGVPPEHRSSGVGGALMRGVLYQYRERGYHVASLYPFRGSYYRRFGYEFGGRRFEISMAPGVMPNASGPLEARLVPESELRSIRSCYETFAKKYSGMNLRNEDQWWRHLGREKPFTVYALGDPIEAYVALRINSGFWKEQEIEELVWASEDGYLSALALMRSIGINQSCMKWYEPSDSPFLARFDDRGVKAESVAQIMWRAVDVPSALQALKPDCVGEFSVEIDDSDVPENRGPWRVRYSPNQVEVGKTDSADIRMDIRPFSQALLGEPSLESLLQQGRAEVLNERGVSGMLGLLPARTTYCLDFF